MEEVNRRRVSGGLGGSMAERQVRRTGKDDDGDITALCNAGAPWSPRSKADAIADIESTTHRYYVQEGGTQRASVKVVMGATGKHLRTGRDALAENNLDTLPNC